MKEFGELREASFLILASLAGAPQHGYGVILDVEHASSNRIELVPSTVYSAIERMVAGGLVAELDAEVVNGRNRKYYELTDLGVERLRVEIDRWRQNTEHATRRLEQRAVDSIRPAPRYGHSR